MFKQIVYYILIVFLGIIQISFLSKFDFFQTSLNLVLVFVIFITLIKNYRTALLTSIILGLVINLYSVFSFGILILALLLPVAISCNLLQKFFARRSILALIVLMSLGTLLYNFIIFVLTTLTNWLNWDDFHMIIDSYYFITILKQTFFNTIVLILIFVVTKFFGQKIRSKFLISETNRP